MIAPAGTVLRRSAGRTRPLEAVSWSLAGRVSADLTVAEAARRLAGHERVTAWSGSWSTGDLLTCDPSHSAVGGADPFTVLADVPAAVRAPRGSAVVGGGWFGWISFPASGEAAFPRWSLAWYPDVVRRGPSGWVYEALLGPGGLDEETAKARCASLVGDLNRPAAVEPASLEVLGIPDRTAHSVAVEECVRAIRRGEIYQANIAGHLDLRLHGSPHDAWARLVERHAPARAALVADPSGAAVSASPELFLQRSGREVRTVPIKGTRPRTGGPADAAERARLAGSAKDAAENVMIVDLMRNDLSRVCRTGTVRVPRLLEVEPHPGVWHLVSEVRGTLEDGLDDADLLRATFPPGSVTGAPKIRAVSVIETLEPRPRGLFTGALGFASPLAGLELNVAIRTLEVAPDGIARLGVGGGVTVDSTPVEEWAECLTKAAPILTTLQPPASRHFREAECDVPVGPDPSRPDTGSPALFETVLVVGGRPQRLADHLARLRRSWYELTGTPVPGDPAAVLTEAVRDLRGPHRARLDLAPDGTLSVTSAPFTPVPLAEQPGLVLRVRRTAQWRRHKLAERAWLDAHEAAVAPDETPLLVDEDGRVLESTRSSLFARIDGTLRTPPADGRILPGIARLALLDDDPEAHPAVVHLDDLARAESAFLTNALRGPQWIRELRAENGHPLRTWPPETRESALSGARM
ncbi:hypothetical protein GCM10009836_11170 [Pseudonocardia ailaonensis]|uniref:Chorismate-utilising enzyme C-terminal domain-containing protein n=1 Tax=Pseudonocardia ailaonensis TaxID=367279 RepID=A0ABN2MR90_9PSEU